MRTLLESISQQPSCRKRLSELRRTFNSFAAVNPQMIDQWDVEKNYPLTAWEVAAYDNRDYHWLCKNGHSFSSSPANRTKGTDCPYCKGKLPVVGVNDFSKICPTIAADWHPTKNEHNQPENFLPNSHAEIWWMCKEGHEWQQMIYARANGSKCPYCQERIPVVGKTDFAAKHSELAKRWSFSKNKKGPELYYPDCSTTVWWECEDGHSFRAPILGTSSAVSKPKSRYSSSLIQPFSASIIALSVGVPPFDIERSML